MRVTAAIFRKGDCVMLMRRGPNEPFPGQWEYPGGKFEPGETGPQCLMRELFEELGINASVGDLVTVATHTTDSGKTFELHAYEILRYTGDIELRVHDMMKWVPMHQLLAHPQLPADLLVSRALVQQGKTK